MTIFKRPCYLLLLFVFSSLCHSYGQMRQIHFDPNDSIATIQKLSFYSPSQGYLTSSGSGGWVGFTLDSGRTITKRPAPISNVDYNGYSVTYPFLFSGVKAFNKDTILVYGAYNTVPSILYSTNGGLNYLLVYHSPLGPNYISSVFDMAFPQNDAIGFAVDGYRILRTTNRGLSWSIVNSDQNSVFGGIDAIDNNNLFVFSSFLSATSSKLVKTSNAGATWQTVTTPNFDIMCADFISSDKGWINLADTDHASLLYYTQNGGSSWMLRNNPEAMPSRFTDMQFINDSTGFSIGYLYQTYKTTDTGKVWEPIIRDNNFITSELSTHSDLQVLNDAQLWAGGWRNLLEINTNPSAPPLPKAYFAIDTTNVSTTNAVLLKNLSKPNYQYKWYVNNVLISTAYNASYTHVVSSQTDSIVLIVTSGTISDTLKKYQHFIVPNLPRISSFSPTSGSTGTEVMIYGTKFTGVNSVKFGGVAAQAFYILSDTVIRAVVATGATGNVSVAVPGGSYSLPLFTYHQPPVLPPPIINSVTPSSGPIGTTVTITGIDFATTPSNNVVYFGATRAVISSSSFTEIVCTVPPGASFEPISVLNASTGLTGHSLKPFNVTFADSANFTKNSFVEAFNFTNNNNVTPMLVMGNDIDGDGKPDVIGSFNGIRDSITVYRNMSSSGNFVFAPGKKIGNRGGITLEANDLDGDGRPEIIAASNTFETNTTFINIIKNRSVPGAISFDNQISRAIQSGISGLAVSDIDIDGRSDIAISNSSHNKIIVIRNTSTSGFLSFAAEMPFSTTGAPSNIKMADFDNDGKSDIACTTNTASNAKNLTCFRNTSTSGNPSFGNQIDFLIPNGYNIANSLTIADFDSDDKLDVIIMGSKTYVFRNISTSGNINFAPSVEYNTRGNSLDGTISNLSGDHKPDIMAGASNDRIFYIKRNTSVSGVITVDTSLIISAPINEAFIRNINSADLNLDGKIDIITSGNETNQPKFTFTVWRNKVGEPVPTSVCAGSTKIIHGDLPGTSHQWQWDNGTGFTNLTNNSVFSGVQSISLTITNVPLTYNNYKFRCLVDGYFSSEFILQVNPAITPSLTITTPTTSVCAGAPVTFTSSTLNGGTNPTYQWYIGSGPVTGANSSTFTTTFATNSQVSLMFSSNAVCATPSTVMSNNIVVSVTGNVPSVSINASSNPVCPNTSVTFTAVPINGGANPSYQWQVNGINVDANSPSFTTNSLSSTSQVKVIMSVTTSCSTIATTESNVITVANSIGNPSVTIHTSNTTVCATKSVTFFATPTSGGTNPSYQWFVNNVAAGINSHSFSPFTLTDGMELKVKMISNADCQTNNTATSNVIILTVNPPVAPTVTISGNTTVIEGQSTSITALTTNGGTFPLLSWEDSTTTHTWQGFFGGTGTTIPYKPAQTGDKLRCTLQSNDSCISSNLVTSNLLVFTVNTVTSVPPVPGISYGIKYYPNPVSTTLYIDSLKHSDKWQTLDIVSVDGKNSLRSVAISNRTSVSVNVAHLPAGIYAAVLRRKTGSAAYLKFIKQ